MLTGSVGANHCCNLLSVCLDMSGTLKQSVAIDSVNGVIACINIPSDREWIFFAFIAQCEQRIATHHYQA